MKSFSYNCATAAIGCGVALFFAAAFAATPAAVTYSEMRYAPAVVADTNANNNVRLQTDFTQAVHGPWLLNPAPDSITICWITRIPCGGGIDYREKGTEEWTRVWPKTLGQIDLRSDLHSHHLTGLKPATTYEYRLINASSPNVFASVYCAPVEAREVFEFTTLDPKKQKYTVFLTADIHGSFRLNLDPMVSAIEKVSAEKPYLYFLLGDNVEDNSNNLRYFATFGFLDDICRHWGSTQATSILRGNHDMWGHESADWEKYFPRRDGKAYFTISQGPVLFICLDAMSPPANDKLSVAITEAYRLEIADWLKGLKSTPEWRNAKFRVLLSHFCTHASEGAPWMEPVFKDVANNGIHAWIFGHEHLYYRVNPRQTEPAIGKVGSWCKSWTNDFNYAAVSLDLSDVMLLDVSPEKLHFRRVNWRTQEEHGQIFDEFEITPDGKVK